jgi:hypothetical protein
MLRSFLFHCFVRICMACAGALVGATDLAVTMSFLSPQQRGTHWHPAEEANGPNSTTGGGRGYFTTFGEPELSPEENRLVWDALVIFFVVAYWTGIRIYRWYGAHADADAWLQWSRQHMLLLNSIGGGWLVVSTLRGLPEGLLRPAFFVGVVMLGWTVRDCWRGRKGLVKHA